MGTWGSGNLQSDGALDYQAEQSRELITRVWTTLSDPASWEADECLYDQLFVDLEWLLTLADAGRLSLWDLPPADDFQRVTTAWLDGWGAYFDGLAGPAFKAERRAVIVATFERVLTHARLNDTSRQR